MESSTLLSNGNDLPAGTLEGEMLSLIPPFDSVLLRRQQGYTEANARASQETSSSGTMPQLTALLVDDNDDLRYLMGLTLGMMGFNVVACSEADSASQHFRSRTDIDFLVTDFEMPGRSGVELARELSALCSSLPVLVVSGSYLSVDLLQEIHERDWRFLAKPYALPAFFANIHELTNLSSCRSQAA